MWHERNENADKNKRRWNSLAENVLVVDDLHDCVWEDDNEFRVDYTKI